MSARRRKAVAAAMVAADLPVILEAEPAGRQIPPPLTDAEVMKASVRSDRPFGWRRPLAVGRPV